MLAMRIFDPVKKLGFVIPVKAGIQFDKNAGFRVKPGMTAFRKLHLTLILILLSTVWWVPCSAQAAQSTILVFGDSLSAAYGIPRESGWVTLLQQELQRSHPQYQVVNASISGETTSGGLRRLQQALKQHQPHIVILELGANDGLRGAASKDIEANLATLIRQAQRSRAKVLLLGMRLPPNYGADYTTHFQALYTQLAQRYHTLLVPFLLEGITPDQFQADNLHPVATAQPRILQNILRELKPQL